MCLIRLPRTALPLGAAICTLFRRVARGHVVLTSPRVSLCFISPCWPRHPVDSSPPGGWCRYRALSDGRCQLSTEVRRSRCGRGETAAAAGRAPPCRSPPLWVVSGHGGLAGTEQFIASVLLGIGAVDHRRKAHLQPSLCSRVGL